MESLTRFWRSSQMPDFLEAETEELALEKLHEMGCTDGLPVVIPTQERVERLILATGLDGDMVLGKWAQGWVWRPSKKFA